MLNLENVDGFVRHLETREEVEDLYFEIFDYTEDEIEKCTLDIESMRYFLVEFYTNTYPYVLVLRPNVYLIIAEDLETIK